MDRNPSNKQTIDRSWRLLDIARGDGQSSYESIPTQAAAALVFLLLAHYQQAGDVLALRGEELRELAINTLDVSAGELKQPTAAYTLDPIRRTLEDSPLAVLEACVEWANGFDLSTPDGRADASVALVELIAEVANRSRWTEYYTPTGVAELMVALADPKPGDRVYDPCLGSGGLLVTAARYVTDKSPDRAPEIEISGVEINSSAYVIGLARVLLTDAPVQSLQHADALAPDTSRASYDLILAVPPWGYKKATEFEFLQHAMDSLHPGGRVIIALPRGFFFRGGQAAALRDRLLSDFRVEGIVSLPERAFGTLTGIQSALLIFSKPIDVATPDSEYVIRFLDLAHPTNRKLYSGASFRATTLTPSGVKESVQHFHAVAPTYDLKVERASRLVGQSWDQLLSQRGDFELNELLENLGAADAALHVHQLDDIAYIGHGAAYKRVDGEIDGHEQPITPLVTPGDLRDGMVLRPRSFTSVANPDLPDEWQLQEGDVLLASAHRGTNVEVGVVPKDLAGALASRELTIVRLREHTVFSETYPEYLAVIFQSPIYQLWLTGHGSGSMIQRLPHSTLEPMLVPLPPTHVQLLVVSRWQDSGGDGARILKDVLLGLSKDPLQSWAESTLSTFYAEHLDYFQGSYVELLRDLDRSYTDQWHKHHDHDSISRGNSSLEAWFEELEHAFTALGRLTGDLPATMQVLYMQQAWILMAHALDQDMMDPRSTEASAPRIAVELTWNMQLNIEYAINEVVSAGVDVDAWMYPDVIPAGGPSQAELNLQNNGNTALDNVRVTTSLCPEESIPLGFLDVGAVVAYPVIIPEGTSGSALSLNVSWSGIRIDRHPAAGEGELTLLYTDTLSDMRADLGTSPYIVGSPVDRPDMLFGREKLLAEIEHQLSGEHGNILFLEGNRRTGKTSILKRLQVDERLQQVVPVYFDAQGLESLAASEIFRSLTYEIGMTLHRANHRGWFRDDLPIDVGRPYRQAFRRVLSDVFDAEPRPFEQFEEYIDLALEEIAPKRLLIMFDEVDKFQDGIDRGEMDSTIFANFRHLLHTNPSLTAIFTGSLRLRGLREDYGSALFGLGQKINVGRLEPESARRLVSDPVQGRLEYSSTARERIVDLCGGQPFLIQQLCNIIFVNAAQSGKAMVDPADIGQSLGRFLENEHFRTVWNNTGVPTQQLLLALCAGIDGQPDPTTVDYLAYRLEDQGIHPSVTSVILDDLEYLTELDLLELTRVGGLSVYELSVPALAQWIRGNVDENRLFAIVREEG